VVVVVGGEMGRHLKFGPDGLTTQKTLAECVGRMGKMD
jgi:hypothetical protein